jgi:hypothetical protein
VALLLLEKSGTRAAVPRHANSEADMDIGVLLLIAAASGLSYAIGRAHEADTQLAQLIAVHLAPHGSETPRTVAPTFVYSPALGVRVEAQSRSAPHP